jgi:hypothetical protein
MILFIIGGEILELMKWSIRSSPNVMLTSEPRMGDKIRAYTKSNLFDAQF